MSDLQHRLTSLHADSIVKSAKRTREFIAILTGYGLLVLLGLSLMGWSLSRANEHYRLEAKDMQEVFHAERL